MSKLKQFFALLRVSHWSKSVFVMLGFFYTPLPGYFIPALLASLAFCLVASAVYIYNDIQDRTEDSLHPSKSLRPLAANKLSIGDAVYLMLVLLITGLLLGWFISKALIIILIVYLMVNLAYNHLFKLIPVLDVLSIAMGFMLRVLAGTLGINLPLSSWLLVAATLLSLFIAFNKRQLELHLGLKNSTRKVLKKYRPRILRQLINLSGIACFITYLLYTLFVRDESFFLILTWPFAAIALWRFAWLSNQNVVNDDPVSVFIEDRLSRINMYCFIALTFMALTR